MYKEECNKCRVVVKDIQVHKLFLHNEKEMQKCPICEKSFKLLFVHLKSHEKREKQCPICKEKFVELNGHMKMHPRETKRFQDGKMSLKRVEDIEVRRCAFNASGKKRRRRSVPGNINISPEDV